MNLTKLISGYIHDQWVNFRRSLDEPLAKGELFAGAMMAFTEIRTTKPLLVYMDKEMTVRHTNPVIADVHGNFPTIFLDRDKPASVTVYNRKGDPLFTASDAREFCGPI